jgi:Zn-dependent protease with chaperone function
MFLRSIWPILFFVPLGPWAGRLCSIAWIDPLYHTLLWLHEHLVELVAAAAAVSAVLALSAHMRERQGVALLTRLARPAPSDTVAVVVQEAHRLGTAIPRLAFLDTHLSCCFVSPDGSAIVLSRGFVAPLDLQAIRLAIRHELAHLLRKDPERAAFWHIVTRTLLLPGFASFERWLHMRRERRADAIAAQDDEERYIRLLSRYHDRRRTPHDSRSSLVPAVMALLVLLALALSHVLFEEQAAYLIRHHC